MLCTALIDDVVLEYGIQSVGLDLKKAKARLERFNSNGVLMNGFPLL